MYSRLFYIISLFFIININVNAIPNLINDYLKERRLLQKLRKESLSQVMQKYKQKNTNIENIPKVFINYQVELTTPLIWLIKHSSDTYFKKLTYQWIKVADVNLESFMGQTPLNAAIHQENLPLVIELLKFKAKIQPSDLLTAIELNDLDIIEVLIKFGANVNKQTDNGSTPLMLAANLGNLQILKFLIAKNSNVNIANEAGHTAIILGSAYPRIVTTLLKHGANIDAGGGLATFQQFATQESIDLIKKYTTFSKKYVSDDCAICLEKMDSRIAMIQCGHTYHSECLSAMPIGTTCPLCRQEW